MSNAKIDTIYDAFRRGGIPVQTKKLNHLNTLLVDLNNPLHEHYLTMDSFNVARLSFDIMVIECDLKMAFQAITQHCEVAGPRGEEWRVHHQALEARHDELVEARENIKTLRQLAVAAYRKQRVSQGLTPFVPPIYVILPTDEPEDIFEVRRLFSIISVCRILSASCLENHEAIINEWLVTQQADGRFDIESEGIWHDADDIDRKTQAFVERKVVIEGMGPQLTWAQERKEYEEGRIVAIKAELLKKATINNDTAWEDAVEVPATRKSRAGSAAGPKANRKAETKPKGNPKAEDNSGKKTVVKKEKKTLEDFKQCRSTVYKQPLPTLYGPHLSDEGRTYHAGSVPTNLGYPLTEHQWENFYKAADDRIWRRLNKDRPAANRYMASGFTRRLAIVRTAEVIKAFLAGTAKK